MHNIQSNGLDQSLKCVPTTTLFPRKIQHKENIYLMKGLLDPGGNTTLIKRTSIPPGIQPEREETKSMNTAAGVFKINQKVYLSQIYMPEFNKTHKINGIWAYVFDAPSQYDIIAGQDLLSKAKVDIKYSTNTIEWIGRSIDMKNHGYWYTHTAISIPDEEAFLQEWHSYAINIKDSVDTTASPEQIASAQTHLNKKQQMELQELLAKFSSLIDGNLGQYNKRKFHIDLKEGSIPVHAKPYPIAHSHQQVFKRELDKLVHLGVLRKCSTTE